YVKIMEIPKVLGANQALLFQERIDELIGQLSGSKGSLAKALDVVCSLMQQRKTNYFNWLSKYHDPDSFIMSVLEPTGPGNGVSWELSYLFTLVRKGRYFAIWESVERKKATYVFEYSTPAGYTLGMNFLASWLSDPGNFPIRSKLGKMPDNRFGIIYS